MDGQYWKVDRTMSTNIWLLTVSWALTWEMIRIRNFYCFVYRQHIWLRKWEVIVGGIMLGFMELGWPMVCRRSTSVLFFLPEPVCTEWASNLTYYTSCCTEESCIMLKEPVMDEHTAFMGKKWSRELEHIFHRKYYWISSIRIVT